MIPQTHPRRCRAHGLHTPSAGSVRPRPSAPRTSPGFPLLLALLHLATFPIAAAPPPARIWLPTNTVACISTDSARGLRTAFPELPPGQLWNDPAMAPFRSHVEKQAKLRVADPLSRASGFQVSNLFGLAEGQVTLGLVQVPATKSAPPEIIPLLLLDAGARTADLRHWLTQRTSIPPLQRGTAEGVEFSVVTLEAAPLAEAWTQTLPPIDQPKSNTARPTPTTVVFAEREGVLVASTSTNVFLDAWRRLAAPPVPPIAPTMPSSSNSAPLLHGFLQVAQWVPSFSTAPISLGGLLPSDDAPTSARIATAFGLGNIRSLVYQIRTAPDGWFFDLQLQVPTSAYRGLFSMFQPLPLPAGPPPLVPAGARDFTRVRFSGPRFWAAFEKSLRDIDPAWLGVLQLFTGYAGKTDDGDFDFEKRIIASLGDDWIATSLPVGTQGAFEKLYLIGTTNSAELSSSLRLVTSPTYLATFFPPDSPAPQRKVRDIGGTPMVTVSMPPMPWRDGATGAFHFAGKGPYLALSAEAALIEAFLSTNSAPPLVTRPDFAAAVRRLGPGPDGYFSFSDERETARNAFASFARSPHALTDRFPWIAISDLGTRFLAGVESWIDGALLPPFSSVSNRFGLRVTAMRSRPDAIEWSTFRPSPKSN